MSVRVYDLLVLGAGPAGLTAGLYGHRAGLDTLIVGGEIPGGQVTLHYRVDNYPGFPGGIPGAQLMANWLKQVIDETGEMPTPESVTQVDFSDKVKVVFTIASSFRARTVIVATGSRPKKLLIPGESEFEGKGVFYCATCDGPLLRTMDRRLAVVLGSGDAAFHTALALIPHAESVTVIMRDLKPKAKPILVSRFAENPKARILTGLAVEAIEGHAGVTGLALETVETGETRTIPADAVFIGIGQRSATEFLQGALQLSADGFIDTDESLQTSVPGVFAAGDVRDAPLRQIISAAADGALAAASAAECIRLGAARASQS